MAYLVKLILEGGLFWWQILRLRTSLPILLLCLTIFYIFYPTLESKFETIDDYDPILRLAHYTGHWTLDDFKKDLLRQEYLEYDGRFRPVQIFLKAASIWAFELRPWLWHLFELGFAIATGLFFFCTFRQFLSPALSMLGGILVFSGLHAEVWFRLATGEGYGMLFFSLGIWLILPKKKDAAFPSLSLYLGSLSLWFAALSKENFIPLYPLALFFALYIYPKFGFGSYQLKTLFKERNSRTFISCLLISWLLHGTIWMIALRKITAQYLVVSVDRWWMDNQTASLLWESGWVVFPVLVLSQIILLIERRPFSQREFFLAVATCLGIWFIPQWVFYGNRMRYLQHYFAPVNLFVVFTITLSWAIILKKLTRLSSHICFGMILALVVYFEWGWLKRNHEYAVQRSLYSRNYHSWLEQIVSERESRNSAIVFCTGIGNMEELGATAIYLKYYLKRPEKFYLVLTKDYYAIPEEAESVRWLKNAAENGDEEFIPFNPKSPPKVPLISVYMSGDKSYCPNERVFNFNTIQGRR